MIDFQDSSARFVQARGVRHRVACWVGSLVLGFAAVSTAQQVGLEVGEGGRARIWRGSGAPVTLNLAPDLEAKVAVEAEGGVVIAGEDDARGELFFLLHRNDSTVELPAPGAKSGLARAAPAIATAGGRMEGAAWVEGSRQTDLSVRVALWNGSVWGDVEEVAPSNGRAQLAPAAAVLEDGTWLVLWAGYDGRDDEIFWSRRVDGAWSQPQRLHADNRVPDVMPTVTAHGDGAIAAWSFFDGSDYRIRTARWTGDGWTTGQRLEGIGVFRSELGRVGERSFLTYKSVFPEAWHLVEIDDLGAARTTERAIALPERPLVVLRDGVAPTLSWPWRQDRSER